ncbi:hypothetical protein PSA01_04960 [Pseudonocardia saturnea]|uniref:Uncharacterized protein n=1 Tax=Pseudonocardia saturnea TaxID=33909 RepID=A0ABQ0RS32_9PSEU|nr:hypothetical protein Pdca_60200 [Pseudonocardia autotrophica]GEC23467.1 hypothetical protein PSA01_04960 [Pseudonocardia saturnea]
MASAAFSVIANIVPTVRIRRGASTAAPGSRAVRRADRPVRSGNTGGDLHHLPLRHGMQAPLANHVLAWWAAAPARARAAAPYPGV